jgi:adenine-specific DNA-methyltransferase
VPSNSIRFETGDTAPKRKARGAFFTPPAIANFLVDWAIGSDGSAKVLDPTCGEAVFLLSAAQRLRDLGVPKQELAKQVYGVDLHEQSLRVSDGQLEELGLSARLIQSDFFEVSSPDEAGSQIPLVDAVVGNPPFIRYQQFEGQTRRSGRAAAFERGVRLSGLASSWTAVLVHASSFLKPDGKIAMVLPAELLTVHYAEPVRRWLKSRFAAVQLVVFERLQFEDAQEKVVLLLAQGSGGCDGFTLLYVRDAEDLAGVHPGDAVAATPPDDGKWTGLLLTLRQRQLFRAVVDEHFVPLREFGAPSLGTVTGANHYFTLSEEARQAAGLTDSQVVKICPPGTKHLRGLAFTYRDWQGLREAGHPVWLLRPEPDDGSESLMRYVARGEELRVNKAYKCRVRTPWWRPPVAKVPDLFFTYMSHLYPRIVSNSAKVGFVNSMHGISLRDGLPSEAAKALPLLTLNSLTMLGAEINGRSYGGGILKMEPREAGSLPVPSVKVLEDAWQILRPQRDALNRQLRDGRWTNVVKLVDDVLLHQVMGLPGRNVAELHEAASSLRERRLGR